MGPYGLREIFGCGLRMGGEGERRACIGWLICLGSRGGIVLEGGESMEYGERMGDVWMWMDVLCMR